MWMSSFSLIFTRGRALSAYCRHISSVGSILRLFFLHIASKLACAPDTERQTSCLKAICAGVSCLFLRAISLCSRWLMPVWLWSRSHSRKMMEQTYFLDICHARPSGVLIHLCSCLMCSRSKSLSINTAALLSTSPNSLNANRAIRSSLVFVLVIDISPPVGCSGLCIDFDYDFRLVDFY